jgi:hypothetical protein
MWLTVLWLVYSDDVPYNARLHFFQSLKLGNGFENQRFPQAGRRTVSWLQIKLKITLIPSDFFSHRAPFINKNRVEKLM